MTKSLTWLLDCMLDDVSMRCNTDTHRDKLTISRRTKHEGLSFLTITLPVFAKDFESCLERGWVDSDSFQSFKTYRKKGRKMALPAFLQGLLSQVFDPVDGRLLVEPSVEAILSVRQICLMFKKVLLECTDNRVQEAYCQYLRVEDELSGLMDRIPKPLLEEFELLSRQMWTNHLGTLDREISGNELVPRHGPGATAEKIFGNQKYNLRTWHERLEPFFPFDAYGSTNPDVSSGSDGFDLIQFVEPGAETPVRVITVPKTLKTPRIIAIEPVCLMYTQQAVLGSLVDTLESLPPSRGHVNFSDQTINRTLSLRNSACGDLATVDLSEASDRVHKDLVYLMLSGHPISRDAIFACRSTRATLKSGKTIHLNKFASMGSALCFPMEAMVFFTLCIQARLRVHNLPLTSKSINAMAKEVYVYGDDIIVPVDEVEAISAHLELFGLKVNIHKSFSRGNFRESCGMDAYAGVDVTPVYVRRTIPANRRDTSELVSFVSLANQLYLRGWWGTARRVREVVEQILGPLPIVQDTAPCLGWRSFTTNYSIQSYDRDLHAPRVRSYVVKVGKYDDPLEGQSALMKCFLSSEELPTFEGHLERSVRPGSVSINRRWAQPF